jgi:regulator of replication initiation timing
MEVEAIRANLAAQQQEAAERASERLRERQAEMGAYPGGAQQWLRNKAQIGVLAEEELPHLRAEVEALRTQVERVVEDRESAADVVAAGADRCEELEATINGLHSELEAAQEAAAVARAENEELRGIVHATAVGDEVVAGMAGMMVSELVELSLRQGDEIQELRKSVAVALEENERLRITLIATLATLYDGEHGFAEEILEEALR